ncbi:MAG: methylated-DNA--[protein]-cysteine S-methyltransferase [Candidatus Geothermincolia bacterium]
MLLAYETSVGKGWIEYEGERVERIYLPGTLRARSGASRGEAPPEVRELAEWLSAWFRGERKPAPAGLNRWLKEADLPEFHRRVYKEMRRIKPGAVKSYSELAEAAGAPRAARAVGNACARNPFPILVPCHRVVRSGGKLGGFGADLRLKRHLLELEGARVDT